MPTRRTPIGRMRKRSFTPEIIAAFRHLVEVYEKGDCTCPPIHWEKYWEERPRCVACRAYNKAEGELVGLLNFKPWERLDNPYMAIPHPPGTPEREPGPDMQRGYVLWRRLEKAAAEETDGE